MKIIIATIKSWNIERAKVLQKKYEGVHFPMDSAA